jgi:hypothetical protein
LPRQTRSSASTPTTTFGTGDPYPGYLVRLVRPGGQIGLVVPGLDRQLDAGLLAHLQPYWESEFYSFHSPERWRRHREQTGHVRVERADEIPGGWAQPMA